MQPKATVLPRSRRGVYVRSRVESCPASTWHRRGRAVSLCSKHGRGPTSAGAGAARLDRHHGLQTVLILPPACVPRHLHRVTPTSGAHPWHAGLQSSRCGMGAAA